MNKLLSQAYMKWSEREPAFVEIEPWHNYLIPDMCRNVSYDDSPTHMNKFVLSHFGYSFVSRVSF